MIADELMTRDPITVAPETTIREARMLMWENDLRHIPVVDDGALLGMLSDRDLRSYLPAPENDLDIDESVIDRLQDPVSACMQAGALSTSPEAEIKTLIDLMLDWRVGAIPVVETGTDSLVGIISYVDVLRAARSAF